MDYVSSNVNRTDFDRMNEIVAPVGLVLNSSSIDWSQVAATISDECVPDYPGPD